MNPEVSKGSPSNAYLCIYLNLQWYRTHTWLPLSGRKTQSETCNSEIRNDIERKHKRHQKRQRTFFLDPSVLTCWGWRRISSKEISLPHLACGCVRVFASRFSGYPLWLKPPHRSGGLGGQKLTRWLKLARNKQVQMNRRDLLLYAAKAMSRERGFCLSLWKTDVGRIHTKTAQNPTSATSTVGLVGHKEIIWKMLKKVKR